MIHPRFNASVFVHPALPIVGAAVIQPSLRLGAGSPSTAASPETGRVHASVPRSDTPLNDAQEFRAMPLPGQNNDHSAPAKPASGP